jgi:chromosome segregation ATPase
VDRLRHQAAELAEQAAAARAAAAEAAEAHASLRRAAAELDEPFSDADPGSDGSDQAPRATKAPLPHSPGGSDMELSGGSGDEGRRGLIKSAYPPSTAAAGAGSPAASPLPAAATSRLSRPRRVKGKGKVRGQGPAGGGGGGGRQWDDAEVAAAYAELQAQAAEMGAMKAAVDFEAVLRASTLQGQIECLHRELQERERVIQGLAAEQTRLRRERYARFSAAVSAADAQLGPIYGRLTGGRGSASCSCVPDETAAFTQGLSLRVMPDPATGWRPLASLSGGQRALASLALCFALQAALPCPFYFFDEVDAALDSLHAARVADFLGDSARARGGGAGGAGGAAPPPQYCVVSHRPAVQQAADMLVGVCCAALGEGSTATTVLAQDE